MFKLSNVKYKDILAIEDLNIKEKKITCIIGESGSGKSTLLKLLNNMISLDEGSLKFKEKDIIEYNPIKLRREILMLAQTPLMFPGTVKNNFVKTLEYAEKELADDELYKILLKKVDLEHQLDRETNNLSGGEKQRIALARVLLLEPKILLLDEPSSALDDKTEEFIIQMVVDYIKKREGTLVMVTHSKKIANEYAETIISLNNGKVQSMEKKEVI